MLNTLRHIRSTAASLGSRCAGQLCVIADRLYHLSDRIYDNVGPVNYDEMTTLFRNDLLAVSRKRQKLGLQFDVTRNAATQVCADIDKRFVAKQLRMFPGVRA